MGKSIGANAEKGLLGTQNTAAGHPDKGDKGEPGPKGDKDEHKN
jgi:hypothetical protein